MTTVKDQAFWKYVPYAAVTGSAIIALGFLLPALAFTGLDGEAYNPLNHFVSELGEIGVSRLAFLFNWGLILGSLITTPFMVYMAFKLRSRLRWLLGATGLLATLFAALVGVLPMNYPAPHLYVALTFFILGLLLTVLYTLVILISRHHPYPRWMSLPGLLFSILVLWLLVWPPAIPADIDLSQRMGGLLQTRPEIYPLAIIEWIVVLTILAWILATAIHEVREQRS